MALFPAYSSIEYGNPVVEEMQFKTLFSNFDDLGEERRKRKWLYPKRLITLQYNNILKLINLETPFSLSIFTYYLARVNSIIVCKMVLILIL